MAHGLSQLKKPYIDKLPLSTRDFEQIKEIAEFGIEAYKKDGHPWISPQIKMTEVFQIEVMFKMRGEAPSMPASMTPCSHGMSNIDPMQMMMEMFRQVTSTRPRDEPLLSFFSRPNRKRLRDSFVCEDLDDTERQQQRRFSAIADAHDFGGQQQFRRSSSFDDTDDFEWQQQRRRRSVEDFDGNSKRFVGCS